MSFLHWDFLWPGRITPTASPHRPMYTRCTMYTRCSCSAKCRHLPKTGPIRPKIKKNTVNTEKLEIRKTWKTIIYAVFLSFFLGGGGMVGSVFQLSMGTVWKQTTYLTMLQLMAQQLVVFVKTLLHCCECPHTPTPLLYPSGLRPDRRGWDRSADRESSVHRTLSYTSKFRS